MKIDSELQKILLQNESLLKKNTLGEMPQSQTDFAEILSQAEAGTAQETSSSFAPSEIDYRSLSAANLATINASLNDKLGASSSDGTMQEFEQEIYTMTAMLDGLDAYAEKLTKTNSDKEAWHDLQTISAQAQNLKGSQMPQELKDLASEIETLVTAEQFKMNRGDYAL